MLQKSKRAVAATKVDTLTSRPRIEDRFAQFDFQLCCYLLRVSSTNSNVSTDVQLATPKTYPPLPTDHDLESMRDSFLLRDYFHHRLCRRLHHFNDNFSSIC